MYCVGGVVSPLLANVYLHYVFDLWVQWWRRTQAHGDVIVVRYADDIITGFEHKSDADKFLAQLRERFAKFGLALHPTKTRLLEFGRYADENRRRSGMGRPEPFDFLGFTHICGKTSNGRFAVLRHTIRKRMQAKLNAIKAGLRQRLHDPIPEVGRWLASVVRGHIQYYAVPTNVRTVGLFRLRVGWLWHRSLMRRSQRGWVCIERMKRLVDHWLPPARVYHPFPSERLCVST